MTNFSDQEWEQRKKKLGGPSEKAFENFAVKNNFEFDRYGFDFSPMKGFSRLPEFIRLTPDYACVGKYPFLVECKGTAFGKYVSIKVVSYTGMKMWHEICPVFVFVNDSSNRKVAFMSFENLSEMIERGDFERDYWMDEGKPKHFYKVPKGVFGKWQEGGLDMSDIEERDDVPD